MDAEALCGAGGLRISPCSVHPICTRGLLRSKKIRLTMTDGIPDLPSHPLLLHSHPITSGCGWGKGTDISLIWEGSWRIFVPGTIQGLHNCSKNTELFWHCQSWHGGGAESFAGTNSSQVSLSAGISSLGSFQFCGAFTTVLSLNWK